MQDCSIVALYWDRNEEAIVKTEEKYGAYLSKIADNILHDHEDSREVVNDTYFRAWCTMPENRPDDLALYLSGITRQLAVDVWRGRHRKKRIPSEYALSLNELEECIPASQNTEDIVNARLFLNIISSFLTTLPKKDRMAFIGRYYYADPLKDIALYLNMTVSQVKHSLHKTRNKLKTQLETEGFFL